MNSHRSDNLALEAFDKVLAGDQLQGQWLADRYLESVIGGPKPAGEATMWTWEKVYPRLVEAMDVLPESFTARRHLSFINPGLPRPGTTNTLLAGLQLVKPQELAWSHRHTISALRFVVKGHPQAFTVVDGERCAMETHDLILTPRWSWHDHHNTSEDSVIWLDVLDVPLVAMLNLAFYEPYGNDRQIERPASSDGIGSRSHWLRPAWEKPRHDRLPLRYPWQEVLRQMDGLAHAEGSPYDGLALEYTNPVNGGPTLPTLSCWIQRLRPGFDGVAHRHTSSAVYFVVDGEGETEVEGKVLRWGANDSFALPGWAWHRHRNLSSKHPALLFSVNDAPMVSLLGLYYEEPEPTWRTSPPPPVPTQPLRAIYRPDAFL